MSQQRFEMLWDCPGCGSAGLLGLTHRHCPACGAPQDPSRRYFPSDEQKVAVEDHRFVGVDRRCPACDTANAAIAAFCGGCGGPMDAAQAVGVRAEQTAAGGSFEADSAAKARAEAEAARVAERAARVAPPVAAPAGKSGSRLWVLGVVAGVVIVCGFLGWLLFAKTDATVEVSGHRWERVVEVETFATISDSAWKEAVPTDARNTACREEQRSTRSVPDGETCTDVRRDNGDGTFSVSQQCETNYREEPVYDTRCTYNVDRWTTGRSERADGSSLTPAPAWPEVVIRGGSGLGAEREASRRESYTARFVDPDGRELTCTLPEVKWAALAVGSRWVAPVGRFVDDIDCDALRAP